MPTEVYSAELNRVVANGDSYQKVGLHYEVPNCLPHGGAQVKKRYTLREDKRPHISVECIKELTPADQTATFKEV